MRILKVREVQGLTMVKWWEWVLHLDMPDHVASNSLSPLDDTYTHLHQGPITGFHAPSHFTPPFPNIDFGVHGAAGGWCSAT